METSAVLAFATLWLALGMSPGPNAAFCVGVGLAMPRRSALFAPLGMALASVIHVAVAGLGIGTLVASSATAFGVVKWVGVVYLAWLGVKQIRSSVPFDASITPGAVPVQVAKRGLVVSLTNPKALLQYAAVMPQFVSPDAAAPAQFAILGLVAVPVVFVDYAIYTMAASWISDRLTARRSAGARRGVGGVYLVAAGLLSRAGP